MDVTELQMLSMKTICIIIATLIKLHQQRLMFSFIK